MITTLRLMKETENKNQHLFDEIAINLKYKKIDDYHYLSQYGTQLRLTTRGFVTFGQFKSIANGSNHKKDYFELMNDFWQL